MVNFRSKVLIMQHKLTILILAFALPCCCLESCYISRKKIEMAESRFASVAKMPRGTPLVDAVNLVFGQEQYEVTPSGMRFLLSSHSGVRVQILFKSYSPSYTQSEIDALLFEPAKKDKKRGRLLQDFSSELNKLKLSDIHSMTIYNTLGDEKVLFF